MAQPEVPQMASQNEQPKPCYLGALAPELLDLIFFETDSVCALANFIATAGFIYHRFGQRKRSILWRVVQNELGPVLVDAMFLRLFPYAEPGRPHYWEAYWDRIHDGGALYREMFAEDTRAVDHGPPRHAPPSLAELTELCRTLHHVNFLASAYIAVQLRSFSTEGNLAAAPPSRTERQRVLRAFYLRQIVSNAWAPARRQPNCVEEDLAALSNTSDHRGVRLGLFAAWEPWELQQIDHANKFVTQLCVALCLAGAEQPAARRIGKLEFGDIFSHADHLARYMQAHPSVAGAALRALPSLLGLGNQEARVAAAPPPDDIDMFIRQYCMLPLRFAWQYLCSETFPDPAREQREADSSGGAQAGGASLNFGGDAVKSPPFGWVDALDGRYLNWYGEALDSHPRITPVPRDDESPPPLHRSLNLWRSAGFTLWDRRRVEAMKEVNRFKTLQTGWALKW
ncbi:hypothetical protein VSDG_06234 [Cytospora chrysosperma]|uniref:Uncharacterized protein n=1 Tax=Cytospora chrysosperma TaxID=252740 RepID=A0A423VSF9_CYTCH|nr:hypothetical protein VSDG_06234 [Valsa sordida]